MNTTAHSNAHISTPQTMASLGTPATHHCSAVYSLRYPAGEQDEDEAGAPMVKFSKQFEAQLVPEWKEAFVDYWQLKKDVKKLQATAVDGIMVPAAVASPWLRQTPPAAAHWVMRLPFLHTHGHYREPAAIQVHKKLVIDGSIDGAVAGEVYETGVADSAGFVDAEAAKAFFQRLDQQLNKVNRFYERKEGEYMERSESLRRQLQILVELKAAITQQQQAQRSSGSSKGSADTDDLSISCSIQLGDQSLRGISEQEEDGNEKLTKDTTAKSRDEELEDQLSISQGIGESGRLGRPNEEAARKLRTLSGRVVTCQGRNVRINIPVTTPSRTVTAIRELLFEDMLSQSKKTGTQGSDSNEKLSINKRKLRQAEKMIRGALIELYKGLGYLKTYRSLNMMAFVKILKKFDKVTEKEVRQIYLKVVESSYFNSSDKAVRLMDDVEELFVRHFTEGDKRKAKMYLKPHQREESHSITFFIGLFTGGFLALFIGYCIMAHIAGMYTQQSNKVYMSTSYPVLSMFSLFFLHLFLYGCNIFMWRKTRINYTFIFEFTPTKELKYRDVFLICTTSMTIIVGVMFAHLTIIVKGNPSSAVQAIPGSLLLVFLSILVCPFNIIYRSSRYQFLRVIRNIILTPFYKVVMVDFFMADQLCSQVPVLRSLEYLACYYITGSYMTQDYGYCTRVKHFRDLAYAVSFLPYYWRAMQCARRWFDEGDINHIVNLGKYVSAMLAAGTKMAYENNNSAAWLSLVVIVSSIATIYQLYWDFVKDWGLLQFNSKNTWLRNDLILKQKYIYFLSMGLNLVLRLAWLQTVIHPNIGSLDSRVTLFFLAALEVIRRGHWNFYRLENEHLNNAGKFRAVKVVPLPFHEVEEG